MIWIIQDSTVQILISSNALARHLLLSAARVVSTSIRTHDLGWVSYQWLGFKIK